MRAAHGLLSRSGNTFESRKELTMDRMYRAGDFAYPEDLPARFLCRVADIETFRVSGGNGQILKLAPLEGPWPEGTILIRPDDAVRRVDIRAHWQAGLRRAGRSSSRHRTRTHAH